MLRSWVWLALALLGPGVSFAAEDSPSTHEVRTYALVAAVGTQLTTIQEQQSTGSHLAPYGRNKVEVPDNLLNKLALHSLDRAVESVDHESKRVYLAVSDHSIDEANPADREKVAFERVVAELRMMKDRSQWYRIVVATPALRVQGKDGLAARVEGFGLFAQPLCQSRQEDCDLNFRPASGARARTPQGKEIQANTFIAPYSALRIWVLDPETLAVLESREVVDHEKIADQYAGTTQLELKDLSTGLFNVIERSVSEAVRDTELRGRVEVSPGKPVP
jgi:hypothetical protein